MPQRILGSQDETPGTHALRLGFAPWDVPKRSASRGLFLAAYGREGFLSFRRVFPPRLWRCSLHESYGGDERVEQARVVPHAGDPGELVVHYVWITPRQVGRGGDAQLAKVARDRHADVRDV